MACSENEVSTTLKEADSERVSLLSFTEGRKPDSVFEPAIYLSQPTPRHRAGRPHLPVYLVLQARVPYPTGVADCRRGLLPRVFTLAALGGGSFLLRPPEDCSPLRFPQPGALSCPDFPHPLQGRDRQALRYSGRKDKQNCHISQNPQKYYCGNCKIILEVGKVCLYLQLLKQNDVSC